MSIETTCAVCRLSDGFVINTIIAAPSDTPPDGCQLIEIMTGQPCGIGWYYINGVFNGPKTYVLCHNTTNEVVSYFTSSYISPKPSTPDGYYIVEAIDQFDIGWVWNGSQFKPPAV